jgi:hypothetical protein
MREYENLTGLKFNRWTVMCQVEKPAHVKNKQRYWLCKCDCGNEGIISTGSLKNGNSKSCGCYDSEVIAERNRKNRKYEMGSTNKLYWAWNHMLQRCEKDYENNKKDYKDRGIKVCDEWHDFNVFAEWALNNGVGDDLSLDRIDVNGNYEPSNCRWADAHTQANNKTDSRYIKIGSVTKTLSQWARENNMYHKTLAYRIDHGWDEKDLFLPPYKKTQ